MPIALLVALAARVPLMTAAATATSAPAPLPPPVALAAPATQPPRFAPKPPARSALPAPPALARSEKTRYRVAFGGLDVGELSLAIGGAAPGATIVHAAGQGAGSVLGLGRYENQLDSDFDLARLDSRRWVNSRRWANEALRDRGEQATPGDVRGSREPLDAGKPAVPMQARLAAPLLDPLGFILRLRAALPAARARAETLYVLDGQAYWRVTVTNEGRSPLPEGHVQVATIKLRVEADPIRFDGTPDTRGDRHHRSIAIWMSDDEARVPVRLSVSLGLGDVVASLAEIERS
ncbi:MAG TPA: DUF3108 domain-containing protein [Polyangia bacterium]|nr:DUF3108 domain-containing protein [Polyangia bacterium]